MSMEMKQSLKQTMQMVITPQLQMAIKLLQVSAVQDTDVPHVQAEGVDGRRDRRQVRQPPRALQVDHVAAVLDGVPDKGRGVCVHPPTIYRATV